METDLENKKVTVTGTASQAECIEALKPWSTAANKEVGPWAA